VQVVVVIYPFSVFNEAITGHNSPKKIGSRRGKREIIDRVNHQKYAPKDIVNMEFSILKGPNSAIELKIAHNKKHSAYPTQGLDDEAYQRFGNHYDN